MTNFQKINFLYKCVKDKYKIKLGEDFIEKRKLLTIVIIDIKIEFINL